MKKVLVAIMLASLVALAAAPAFAVHADDTYLGKHGAGAADHKRAHNYGYTKIDKRISSVAYTDKIVPEDKCEGQYFTSDWIRVISPLSKWLPSTEYTQFQQRH